MKIIITEQQLENIIKKNTFLGYHSSKNNLKDGFYKSKVLDPERYSDVIKNAYMEIISDYDVNLENDDIDEMNNIFQENDYGFTFVSDKPIMGTNYQSSEYKYGDYLYKVYGDGNEILLDDVNEIGATIVVSKNQLYFEKVKENLNENKFYKGPKYYKEDPQFSDNDVYHYKPTQDEIDKFINDKYQLSDYEKMADQYGKPKKEKKKKDNTPKPKKNGYAFLYYLSQQMGYGPINLMKWKKRTIMDNNKMEGMKFKVVPDTGEIKQHNSNRYFYF